MKQSKAMFVVTAGLAGVLALGAFGCSSKTETTTTVSDGSTTTETTTTTTNSNGSTTTETTTTTTGSGSSSASTANLDEIKSYNISSIGLHYNLPDGFKFSELTYDIDTSKGDSQCFVALNDKNDNVILMAADLPQGTEITDPSFIEDRVKVLSDTFTSKGGTIKDTKTDPYKVTAADGSEKTFPSATFTLERDGSTNLVRVVFMHDGEHLLVFNMVADDEATIDAMLKGISVEG